MRIELMRGVGGGSSGRGGKPIQSTALALTQTSGVVLCSEQSLQAEEGCARLANSEAYRC